MGHRPEIISHIVHGLLPPISHKYLSCLRPSCKINHFPSSAIDSRTYIHFRGFTSASKINQSQELCFYHQKFGVAAKKCASPCSWNQSSNANQRPSVRHVDDKRGASSSGLFFVEDSISHVGFLIDTGSTHSLLPCHRNHSLIFSQLSTTESLCAANGTKIPAYELVKLTVSFGLNREFTWDFRRAEVQYPVIEIDFLCHFKLNVNIRDRCLNDTTTNAQMEDISPHNPVTGEQTSHESLLDGKALKDKLMYNFVDSHFEANPDLFDLSIYSRPHRHKTQHHIITTGPPV